MLLCCQNISHVLGWLSDTADNRLMIDRKLMASVYKLKSDESYLAAQECLNKQLYRGACNGAWYSVMQIVTAAVYEDLQETPPNGKPNWVHERQSSLFRSITSKHNLWKQHRNLAIEIDMMRERRNHADYVAPIEMHADRQGAERSFQVAGQVREIIIGLLGKNWQSTGTPTAQKVANNGD